MKFSINKIFFCLAACFCLSAVTYAQQRHVAKAAQLSLPLFTSTEEEITRVLTQRVQNSYRQLRTQLYLTPGQHFSQPFPVSPAEVYPDAFFLTNSQQLELYFISRNNRATRQMLTDISNQLTILQKNRRAFYAACQHPTIPSTKVPAWLASQIPQKTDYLFLGEQHKVSELKRTIISLLPEIKNRFANRPILLFTEFLPEQQRWEGSPDIPYKNRLAIWQQAQALQIPVIGLEPQFVLDNSHIYLASATPVNSENIWSSLEGAQIRNNRWSKTLAKYRKKYPDALFIIYSGDAHASYSEPHSLGSQLEHANTFVVSLHPQHSQTPVFFDILTDEVFANEPILHIQNKNFSRVAGFDIQVKVPNPSEEIE